MIYRFFSLQVALWRGPELVQQLIRRLILAVPIQGATGVGGEVYGVSAQPRDSWRASKSLRPHPGG